MGLLFFFYVGSSWNREEGKRREEKTWFCVERGRERDMEME